MKIKHTTVLGICLAAILFLTSTPSFAQQTGFITGELKRWHPIEIAFTGETACESWNGGANALDFNPFLHRRLVVTFTNGNTTYDVPGFFNASGLTAFSDEVAPGNECGDQWAVRFIPDQTGTWNYSASFRQGENIAVDLNPTAGTAGTLDGISGSFDVAETDKEGVDFRAKGILRYVNEHYPRFDNGEYYIKTGVDSPENFLGYDEFHNTFDHEIRNQFGPFIHSYPTHANDYNLSPGVLWGANNEAGRNIYGAVNYLSSVGVNSVYMINYGIDGGDGGDVWPWSCPNALVPGCDENKLTFDVSKLDQWQLVLRHMDEQGIQIHFVFTEQENDRDLTELQWKLYFREMIARFSAHHAVIWNLGEENFWQSADNAEQRWTWQREQAAFIRAVDPYNHRITTHTINGQAFTYYDGLLGNPDFEATSIQQNTRDYNALAIDLRERSAQAGRPWIIYGDEQPDRIDSDLGNWDRLREQALWGNLMGGGGGIQWYIAYQGNTFGDINLDDFRLLEPVYVDSAIARQFFELYVTNYWTLTPDNSLVRTNNGSIFALAAPGEFYAVYVEEVSANNELDLRGVVGTFNVGWYSPRTARYEVGGTRLVGGSWVSLGQPPFSEQAEFNGDSATDYAAVIFPATSTSQLDVDEDGQITPADAVYVVNRLNTQDLTADVNGDNTVNNADVNAVTLNIGQSVLQN